MRLNDFQSHMTSLSGRWPGFFANANYIRADNEITWPNRINFDVETTPELLATLIEHRQFSMQVVHDGSIFQLYYGFSRTGGRLAEASLGFFFGGESAETIGDPYVEGVMPTGVPENPPGWVRLDFDPAAGTDCVHYHSHLHLSLSSNVRIPVKRVPTPKQFVELIIAWFYPEIYRQHRLVGGQFELPHDDARTLFEESMLVAEGIPQLSGIHVSIP